MLRRTAQLSVGLFLAFCPVLLSAQANPPQFYIFCAAQAPPPTAGAPAAVYYSGIMQGTAANLQMIRTDFAQFLMQKYAYKGAAACAPSNSMANAQTAMNNQMTAFRNAKRNVVETGWSEGGAAGILGGVTNPLGSGSNPLGNIFGGGQSNTNTSSSQPKTGAAGGQTTAGGGQGQTSAGGGGNVGGGGNAGGAKQSTFNNVFGQIFGSNGGGGNGGGGAGGGGAKPTQGQTATTGKPATGGTGATGGGGGNQSPFSQVSGELSNIFGNKGGANGGGGRGGQPGQPGQPGGNTVAESNAPKQPAEPGAKPGQPAQAEGVLGSAQFGTTKLDIYGCGRQDLQVACVGELTNQNPKDTLVKTSDIWKDAFIVDDRGDRHTRTNAFFLNVDGEQRPQLDISNGKTAKFVLMFDQVPAKVQSIALRSQNGNMDVENIGLVAADASAPSATSASTSAPAPTPPPTQH